MSKETKSVRVELTEEQKALVRERIGQDVWAFEVQAEELEPRVAPISLRIQAMLGS